MENAVFTFEQLLSPHLQGEASKTAVAIEKVKLRVLKVKLFCRLWETQNNCNPLLLLLSGIPNSVFHSPVCNPAPFLH